MKGVLYNRVSSDEQADGFSLEAQEKEGIEYADKNKIEIVKIFIVAESASHEGRQTFNEAINYLLKHSDVTVLLVSKMDRAIRNLGDMAWIDEIAHKNGKQIHFYHEGWKYDKDSTIADFYRFGFMSVMATGFSRNLSDITKIGLKKKAESGQFPGSAPFGYKNNKETHMIEVDPDEARWAVRIKKLAATEISIEKIKDAIAKEGCPYKLVSSKIERIIKSTFYIGRFEWNKETYNGHYAALIDKKLHDAAVAGLSRLNKPRQKTQFITYRGLMTCGVCGCAITAERRKEKYVYYHCTWRKGNCDNIEYMEQKELEKQFEQILDNIYIDKEKADIVLLELEQNSGKEVALRESKRALLKQEYERVKSRSKLAYEDKLDGKLLEIDWVKKDREWKDKLLSLETEIKNLECCSMLQSLDTLRRMLELSRQLKNQFKSLPEEKRGQVMKFVCWNLKLTHKTVSFSYAKPFDVFAKTVVSGNWGG